MKKIFTIAALCLAWQAGAQTGKAYVEGNKILLDKNGETITVAAYADEASFLERNGHVYYLETGPENKIASYNLQTGESKDLITIGMESTNGYVVKSAIVNMLPDPNTGRLYFTTEDTYQGNLMYMTWEYDPKYNTYSVISDGKVVRVNKDNMLDIVFTGADHIGEYSQKVHYNAFTRKLTTMEDRTYKK